MLTAIRNGAIRRIRERVEDEDRSTVRSIAGPAFSFPSAALWGEGSTTRQSPAFADRQSAYGRHSTPAHAIA
jgi:hypothetical protein